METESISEIASNLSQLLPPMSGEQQKLSLAIFQVLSRGEPALYDDIAKEAAQSEETVRDFLKDHPGAYHDKQGRVVGYMGLAVKKMSHRFTLGERHLYTWCAWDSLFIPELLNQTARVESRVPDSDEIVRLTVGPKAVENVLPESAVLTVLLPELSDDQVLQELHKDVITSFCHHVHFFPDRAAAEKWTRDQTGKYAVLSVPDGYELGRRMNEHGHGQALAARSA